MHTRHFAPSRPHRCRVRVRERHAFEALVKRQRNPDKSTTNAAGRRGTSRKPVNRGKKEEDEQGAGEREDEDEEDEQQQEEEEEKEEDEDEDDNGDGDDDDEDGGRPVAEGVDIHAGTRGRRTRPARTHTHSKM